MEVDRSLVSPVRQIVGSEHGDQCLPMVVLCSLKEVSIVRYKI